MPYRLAERTYGRVARAALRALPRPRAGRAAVLMYHSVCRLPVAEAGFYQHVLPDQFAEQMAFLEREGWRVLPLGRLVAMLETGRRLPPRAVAITFDDGYRSLIEVWPHLERRGFPATLFLATGYVDGLRDFSWLRRGEASEPPGLAPIGWGEVRELVRRGAAVGSHSVNHLPLDALGDAEILSELTLSREDIEGQTGRPVRLFSVPFACPEADGVRRRLAALLRQAGYAACVTTAIGRLAPGDDLMALPRLPVNALDTLATFEAKLRGAYDWLRPVQRAYKLWLKPQLQGFLGRPGVSEAPQLRGKP